MKKISVPLFWQFTIAILTIVALFGTINVLLIWHGIYNSLENELEKRGLFISKSIAEKSVNSLLYDDIADLYKLVDIINTIDTSVAYVFILNGKNKVIAHTFETNVPQGLINANQIKKNKSKSTVLIKSKNKNNKLIRDIAVPILDGKLGIVRVGLNEENIYANIKNTIKNILIMISVFLFTGIFTAFIFSYIITNPIKLISKTSENIDIDSLKNITQNRVNISGNFLYKFKRLFYAQDELDLLVAKFNEMLERLEKTYTELQLTQSSLLQSEKLASIGTLTAGIAHEINNPISGLQNCLRRISRDPTNIQQNKKYLVMMEDAANKVENVIQNLLNFARKHDLVFQKVDVRLVIENALILAAHKIEKSHISIKKDFPDVLPEIQGSSNHLEQVMLNLIINSADAIDERRIKAPHTRGEINFNISIKNSELLLMITDNGIGMPADEINKIFDPFFTTKKEGTGLGLSVGYNIIKEHKGEIKAESLSGKWMKFTINLPIYNEV